MSTQVAETTATDVANIGTMSDLELKRLIGQDEGFQGLPRLSINHAAEDEDDTPLPRGYFGVQDPETGQMVYSKTAIFRPFMRTYSYSVWDNDEKAFAVQSIQAKSFNEPMYDTAGTLKCGKLNKAETELLEKGSAEHTAQKNIKCNQIFYGVVTMEGKTAAGDKVTLTELPCQWYAKGASFMPIADYIKTLGKQNKVMLNIEMVLTSVKEKAGGNTYFRSAAATHGEVEFTEENLELLGEFQDTVRGFNSNIMGKYEKSIGAASDEAIDLMADLEDDPE